MNGRQERHGGLVGDVALLALFLVCTEALAFFVLCEVLGVCGGGVAKALIVMAAVNAAAMLMGVGKAVRHLYTNRDEVYGGGDGK